MMVDIQNTQRRLKWAVVAVFVTLVSGCGPKEPIYATQAEVEEIRNEVMRTSASNAEKIQSSQHNSRSIVGNIEELQFQIGELHRQIATLQSEVRELKTDKVSGQNGIYDINNGVVPQDGYTTEPPVPATVQYEVPTEEQIAPVEETSIGTEISTSTDATSTESPELIYQRAFEALRVGEVGNAINDLNIIVTQYPNHDYADESLYWVGEAQYISNDSAASKIAFNRLVTEYPESPQYPDALLRLGLIAVDEGKTAEAKQYFTQVVEKFPQTRAGITAQNHLAQLDITIPEAE